jgi:small nuclear ribonucleoprotein (snRNP)-like protein
VGLPKGIIVPGSLEAFDLHYNIALVNVQSDIELRVASFRLLDNSLDINHDESCSDICQSFELTANPKTQKISDGDMCVIVGRMHEQPFRPLISSGELKYDI